MTTHGNLNGSKGSKKKRPTLTQSQVGATLPQIRFYRILFRHAEIEKDLIIWLLVFILTLICVR